MVRVIPSVRVFFAGNSGSGKTTGAWRLYLSRFPRQIILDQTGEWLDKVDYTANTLGDLANAIRQYAPDREWTIAYTLLDDRFADFVRWLVPVPNVDTSPILAIGGAVLLVDEVDLLAPQGPASVEVRTLYRRSRHAGLSVVSATQRPANVSREVSAQSQHVVAYYLSEPRDRDYIADLMRWNPNQVQEWIDWTRLHPHGAAWKEVQTGRVLWIPDLGAPIAIATRVPPAKITPTVQARSVADSTGSTDPTTLAIPQEEEKNQQP